MSHSWIVEEMNDRNPTEGMETFAMKRLKILATRLRNVMKACSEIMERNQMGEEHTEDEEVALNKLQVATENFNSELKDQTKEFHGQEDYRKLEEFSMLIFEAQDLLSTLKVHNRRREKPENDHPNTTSRLPKLEMMKFDGDKLKWSEFWDSFLASVDKRKDLSNVDKLTYLNGLLEKDAKEAIRGLTITNKNYSIAVEELKDQFGKPEVIIDAHYRALNKLPPAGRDIKECRRTRAEIERHLKVLSTLGEPVNSNNQLRSMIMDKFPENILYELRMIMKSRGYSVAIVRQGLKDIISANDEIAALPASNPTGGDTANRFTTEVLFSSSKFTDTNKTNKPTNERGNPNKWKSGEKRPHNAQSREPPEKKFMKGCVFCDGSHYNERCMKYQTLEERIARLQDRCTICLAKGHKASECRIAKNKNCWHCKENSHNRSICPTLFKGKAQTTTTLFSLSETRTILQTATANIYHANGIQEVKARLLFDCGSQKTYITEKMAKTLKLDAVEDLSLSIYTFGTTHPTFIKTRLVNVNIHNPNGNKIGISALVMPTITGSLPAFKATKDNVRLKILNKPIANDADEDCPADILIGNDHYHSFFTGATEKIGEGLYLLHSKLGWIISGRVDTYKNEEVLSFLTYVQREQGKKRQQFTVPDPPLQDDKIKDLWELECIGIRDSPKILEEDEIVKLFNNTTQFYDGRYHVKWPWSQYPSDLPINLGMALGRLNSLLRRTDTSTLERYDEVLHDQLSKGMIEIIHDRKLPRHPVHYLPHHCVIQEGKTTKLRIVYDASSKTTGYCSLNEYLYKGPLLLEDLVGLLLSFRTHAVGIVADVEKAFLQIGLQDNDRDVTRFLWVRDIHKEAKGDNVVHFRFCRVPFGVISSPYLLAATVKHHLLQQNSPIALKIGQNLYVDNLVTGATSTQSASELYNTAKVAFEGLSMNIREWDSNSAEFLKNIPEEQRTTSNSSSTPVLGLKWDTNQDRLTLAVDLQTVMKSVSSKREILRQIASVYDPCGLIAPLLLSAKIFLQNLWLEKYKWDTSLPAQKVDEWNKHASHLRFIKHCSFPRYFFEGPVHRDEVHTQSTVELHCFSDASAEAYAAAVYIRSVKKGETIVNLAMSRTRLIPIKNRQLMTTPKRELLGVLIGTRLIRYVYRNLNLPINSLFVWTDSKIVLGWLMSTNLLQPFVSKRITEIKSASDIRFRYVPSGENPADIATRPQYSALPSIWFHGPQFLELPENKWPLTDYSETTKIDQTIALPVQGDLVDPDGNDIDEVLSSPEFDCSPNGNHSDENGAPVTLDPGTQWDDRLQLSEKDTIKQIQLHHYPKELAGKSSPLTKSLGLFVDKSGILRCSGRLQNSGLPYDQMHPILLPGVDPFTTNIIKHLHVDNKHVGVSHTLTLLRRKYWVPKGRSKVEAVLKQCEQCVKYGGGPYKLPPMPPLPEERVRLCTPFTYTGLDYLGPLTVDENGTSQKRWCCIFTCMASRAIRLELVKNLTAEEFLLCLRRFVAAQGPPLLIVSDNAAQFKLVADVVTSSLVQKHKIAWHFIAELSRQGGFYERLVSLVKHCLRRSLDKILLNGAQLNTILKEIETVLNSRPLTHVGTDLDIVLTPSDFLSNCGTLPLLQTQREQPSSITATKSDLIHSWSQGQKLLQEFTSLFQDRYLSNLRERAMAPHRQHRIVSKLEPRVGARVQIWDGQSKTSHRSNWKVGKIIDLFKSHDGHVRTARVALNDGGIINRSISFLYPLELDDHTLPKDPPTSVLGSDSNLDIRDEDSPASPLLSTASDSPAEDPPIMLGDNAPPTAPSAFSELGETDPAGTNSETEGADKSTSHILSRRRAAEIARQTIRQWTQVLLSLCTQSV